MQQIEGCWYKVVGILVVGILVVGIGPKEGDFMIQAGDQGRFKAI
jgi:hypothetical protein